MIGTEIKHPRYGIGVITDDRKAGMEHKVVFEDGYTKWVRIEEYEPISTQHGASQQTTVSPKSSTTLKNNPSRHQEPQVNDATSEPKIQQFESRKLIEAVRLGIVADSQLELATIGRKHELKELDDWLAGNESSRMLIGRYGTGKTHLLRVLRQRALKQGYAVSLVSLDPYDAPMSKPKLVYREIMRSLTWLNDDKEYGARELILLGKQMGLLDSHKYYSHLNEFSYDRVWRWILAQDDVIRPNSLNNEYHRNRYPPLYNYAVAANIYCYLLSGLGYCCEMSGRLNGLLILFDESEALHSSRNKYHQEKGRNFLDALIATANQTLSLDRADYLRFSSNSFEYSRNAAHIPFQYMYRTGLKLLFAFTDRWGVNDTRELRNVVEVELSPIADLEQKSDIFNTLKTQYEKAYQIKLELDTDANLMLGELLSLQTSTRGFVKGIIEMFDIVRFGTYQDFDRW